VELYLHSPTRLHCVVLNYLNTAIGLSYLYDDYGFGRMTIVKMCISGINKVEGQILIFMAHKYNQELERTWFILACVVQLFPGVRSLLFNYLEINRIYMFYI
jgi:hypothetical protein